MGIYYVPAPDSKKTSDALTEESGVRGSGHEVDVKEMNSGDGLRGVIILTQEEFNDLTFIAVQIRIDMIRLMASRTNYIQLFPNYFIGSFAVPTRESTDSSLELISFYLDEKRLIFVTESQFVENVFNDVATGDELPGMDCSQALFFFMNSLLSDELGWLAGLEELMEDLEEQILTGQRAFTTSKLMELRRTPAEMGAFYQALGDMATVLSDDKNSIITESAARKFENLATHCDKLESRADSLKEYSLQLRELYQTVLSEKQNYTMEVLTVVTVIIAPMTLLTGWYGMNIAAPGMHWEHTWIAVLLVGIFLAAAVVFFVRWKKWH